MPSGLEAVCLIINPTLMGKCQEIHPYQTISFEINTSLVMTSECYVISVISNLASCWTQVFIIVYYWGFPSVKAEAFQSLFIATSSFGFLLQATNMVNKVKREQGKATYWGLESQQLEVDVVPTTTDPRIVSAACHTSCLCICLLVYFVVDETNKVKSSVSEALKAGQKQG